MAVHATIHPDTCRRLAEQAAAERGVAVVDAPVSGGGPAAAQGKLLVMAGGDAEHVDRAAPSSRPSATRWSTWARSAAARWPSC